MNCITILIIFSYFEFYKAVDYVANKPSQPSHRGRARISLLCKNSSDWNSDCAALRIPKNNSHYIEGKSRFIWMSDGGGEPILVDLWYKVDRQKLGCSGIKNKYWLYTKNNTIPDEIQYQNISSIQASYYNPELPLNVITHGWTGNLNSKSVVKIRDAFLAASESNVLVMDWEEDASSLIYPIPAHNVAGVGKALGKFLMWFKENSGGGCDKVHLVGFSLGAHVVGNAGRTVNGSAIRITGLDPAGPLFYDSPDALKNTDGNYVEVIHTDAGVLGFRYPLGHVDFYPNTGTRSQPGCVFFDVDCSHFRAYELFAASIQYNDKHFGELCGCFEVADLGICCGKKFKMGTDDFLKNGVVCSGGSGRRSLVGSTVGCIVAHGAASSYKTLCVGVAVVVAAYAATLNATRLHTKLKTLVATRDASL